MKKTKELKINVPILEVSKLVIGGTYWNVKNEIVVIKSIDTDKEELHFHNLSDQCHRYVKFSKNDLVKQIR
jgi:hypothetical protein